MRNASVSEPPEFDLRKSQSQPQPTVPIVRPFRRYLMFAWFPDMAAGGFSDFQSDHDTEQEAFQAFFDDERKWEICEVVDWKNRASLWRMNRTAVGEHLEKTKG